MRPSFANSFAPKKRGRREDRVRAAPAVPCAKVAKKNAHEHTGSAEAVRPSLRNGFTAYFVLSSARPGLFATVARVMRSIIASLTPATGASGPHDFAVRVSHARQSQLSRPPHPTARFVTCATPLLSGGTARNTQLIWVKNKAEYFSREGWTGFGAREVICPSGQLVASESGSSSLRDNESRANARSITQRQFGALSP